MQVHFVGFYFSFRCWILNLELEPNEADITQTFALKTLLLIESKALLGSFSVQHSFEAVSIALLITLEQLVKLGLVMFHYFVIGQESSVRVSICWVVDVAEVV